MMKDVSHILGTSRNIKETDSSRFYKSLQSYVDSKEKATGNKDKDGKKPKKEREFWPLIRVVRLYVKSPALATGAVIVDLPGFVNLYTAGWTKADQVAEYTTRTRPVQLSPKAI